MDWSNYTDAAQAEAILKLKWGLGDLVSDKTLCKSPPFKL